MCVLVRIVRGSLDHISHYHAEPVSVLAGGDRHPVAGTSDPSPNMGTESDNGDASACLATPQSWLSGAHQSPQTGSEHWQVIPSGWRMDKGGFVLEPSGR